MAKAAMQQDHGWAGPVRDVPDPGTIMFDVALIICGRQLGGTVRLEPAEIIVACFRVAHLV